MKPFLLSILFHFCLVAALATWASVAKTRIAFSPSSVVGTSVFPVQLHPQKSRSLAPLRVTAPSSFKKAVAAPSDIQTHPSSLASFIGNLPRPFYPELSKRNGEEGETWIGFEIGDEGNCQGYWLEKTSGFPRLDQASLDALDRFRSQLACRSTERPNKNPTQEVKVIAFRFRLSDEKITQP